MKSEEFDRAFDDGEDITSQLDLSAARRPGLEQRRVNVDFPAWMIESLDREARRLGVNRQSIIKVWIAERLERNASPALQLPSVNHTREVRDDAKAVQAVRVRRQTSPHRARCVPDQAVNRGHSRSPTDKQPRSLTCIIAST